MLFPGYLDVEYNQLSGTIPSEFFNLPQIQELRLGGNVGLSGVIDGDMFRNASTLTELTLFDAPAVSGSFPSEMFDLPSLSVIDVHSCSITGTLSEDFSRLSLLESLIVHNNTLRGTIPSAFDGLLNLRKFPLEVCSWQIPFFGNKANLTKLYIYICVLVCR